MKKIALILLILACFSTCTLIEALNYSKNLNNILTKKLNFLHEIVEKAVICYRRYQECSDRFSGNFCISPLQHFSFYIWARRMANDILNGKYDEHKNVTCSKRLVKNIVDGQLSNLVKLAIL